MNITSDDKGILKVNGQEISRHREGGTRDVFLVENQILKIDKHLPVTLTRIFKKFIKGIVSELGNLSPEKFLKLVA